MRILLETAYCGSAYHGFQIQPNADTVQARIEAALSKIYCTEIHIAGCSRTDAGVHAKSSFCQFDTDKPFDISRLPDAVNAYLPKDICIISATEKGEDFHCRFCVKSKTYEYLIWNKHTRNPLYFERALHFPFALDAELMDKEAKYYIGTHDFAAFMAQGSPVESTVRTVHFAGVERDGDFVKFTVCGNGFLYNMVRIMVGTLMWVSLGKIEKGSIPEIIKSKDRKLAGPTVGPEGLYLAKVEY